MEIALKAVLLGVENKVSKKDNPYVTVLLQQGGEAFNCMVDSSKVSSVDISKLECYKPYNIKLDFNMRYKQFKLVGITA